MMNRYAEALRVWRSAKPAAGTLAERYLRACHFTLSVPDRLRYAAAIYHEPSRSFWPAMLGLVTDLEDRPIAVHCTFLSADGSRKAPVEPTEATLGDPIGGAVRLGPGAEYIVVSRGIETSLIGLEMAGLPAWATLTASGIATLDIPAAVRGVLLALDRDDDSRVAALAASAQWRSKRPVTLIQPHAPFRDYIEAVRAERRTQ